MAKLILETAAGLTVYGYYASVEHAVAARAEIIDAIEDDPAILYAYIE